LGISEVSYTKVPTMKAIICQRYGAPENLHLKELPKPNPKPGELLIRIKAGSVHIGDTRVRRADPFLVRLVFGLFKPKKNLVLGIEVSGIIEALGAEVGNFKVGDEVFALTGFGMGGYAEYITLPAIPKGNPEWKGLVNLKPSNLSFAEAAVMPAACLTVIQNFRKVKVEAGQSLLINGASGSLGTYAIQIAKHLGLSVTAVCSAGNKDLVMRLGADEHIDYQSQNFLETEQQFDVVYDAVLKSSRKKCRAILKPQGVYLNNYGLPRTRIEDLEQVRAWAESGVVKPVMDRSYDWSEVIEGHRYVDQGHKKGNVSLIIAE